jgi:hypothetical protein
VIEVPVLIGSAGQEIKDCTVVPDVDRWQSPIIGDVRLEPAAGLQFAVSSPMPKQTPTDNAEPGLQRDPDEWKTGDEPRTAAQRSYLETLCRETGDAFDDRLTKAEASKRIDELQERSPRLTEESSVNRSEITWSTPTCSLARTRRRAYW